MKKVLIINGPNINLTGKREKGVYGEKSFDDLLEEMQNHYKKVEINYFQTNIEGEIIEQLHKNDKKYDGIILNPGGYTHTSVSIRDAISAIETPVTEVHMSNIASREKFRHTSYITGVCDGCIMGFKHLSYYLAIEKIIY